MTKRLEHMKETLMCAVEMQLCDLGEVDTQELGEAIDMIKDLEEAIYYCTVTEAMKGNTEMEFEMKKSEKDHKHLQEKERMYYSDSGQNYMYRMPYHDDNYMYEDDHMYARRRRADGTFYSDGMNGQNYNDNGNGQNHMDMNGQNYRDNREGRSYASRKMYMEAKEMKKDKASQLRELEKYMQELSQDIVEMISDSSPEEKQYLEKKISALASKVGQMK